MISVCIAQVSERKFVYVPDTAEKRLNVLVE